MMFSGSPSRAPVLARSWPLEIGTSQHFQWLNGVVKGVLWLNLLDAVFTLWWVRTGMAVEANAFIRDLAHGHALGFVLAKLALVSLGSLFLWRYRRHPLAVVAIFGAFFIYYLVLLHHLQYSGHFLRQFLGL